MIEDHEIEIIIRDTNNNVLKIEKVPARAARVNIYVQMGQPNTGLQADGCQCAYPRVVPGQFYTCINCGKAIPAAAKA